MATLEQERAKLAFQHVGEMAKETKESQKKYGSLVHKMPTLLRTAGLSQALAFVQARKDEPQRTFLCHLAAQLHRVDKQIKNNDPDSLLKRAREAELADYLRLSHEALACSVWYRRFVQGVLNIEATANANDDENQ